MKKIIYMLLLVQSGLMIAQKNVVTASGEKVTISPFANNGLSTSGNYTQLGGSLIQNSVLTTNSYTLAIMGLGTGTTTDNILVADPTTGVLKKLSISSLPAPANAWSTTGNTGTNPANNFVGTTDNNALAFRVNNTNAGSIQFNTTPGNASLYLGYETAPIDAVPGGANVGIGALALGSLTAANWGGGNTALGASTLFKNTDGTNNTAVGRFALKNNTTASNNTAVGISSLFNTTGGYNTALGSDAGGNITSGTYNIMIGSTGVNPSVVTANNELNVGNVLYGTNVNVDSTPNKGKIGINTQAPSTALHIKPSATGADPLTVEKLNTGSATDKFVVVDPTTGVFRTVDRGSAGTAMRIRRVTGVSAILSDTTDDVLLIDATGAGSAINVTVPSCAAGRVFTIKRVDSLSATIDVKIQFPGIVDEGPGNTITVGDKVTYQVISEGSNKWQTISRF